MRRALIALAIAFAALPGRAAPRQKVAVLDVRTVQGVAQGTATILTAIIAGDTAAAGFDVLSQADIAALIGFEKQKRMLGCGDDSSCLAEIGGALGAEYVLSTQVGQIGTRFHLSLQLLDARKGAVIGRVSTFSETSEDALAETAQRAVSQALASARERAGIAAAARATASAAKVAAPAEEAPAKAAAAIPAAAAPVAVVPAPRSAPPPAVGARPGSPEGETFFARRPPYVDVQLGTGYGSLPLHDRAHGNPFDKVALAVRGGVRWTREWAFEVGAGFQDLVHRDEQRRFQDTAMAITRVWQSEGEIKSVSTTAGVAWTPRGNRYFSVAADVGVSRTDYSYRVRAYNYMSLSDEETTLEQRRWLPRVGAELRLDYPFSPRMSAGLRLGFVALRANTRVAVTVPTGDTIPPQDLWIEEGVYRLTPVSLSFRYAF
jgi:hypothetical protein